MLYTESQQELICENLTKIKLYSDDLSTHGVIDQLIDSISLLESKHATRILGVVSKLEKTFNSANGDRTDGLAVHWSKVLELMNSPNIKGNLEM